MITKIRERLQRRQIKGFRRRELGEDGQAMIEFLLSFPWVFLMTLAVMQFALMYTAQNMVDYAAFCAARSATVFVGRYEVMDLGIWSQYSTPGELDWAKKFLKIHIAAALPMTVVSPEITVVGQGWPGIGGILQIARMVIGALPGSVQSIIRQLDKFAYAYAAVSVDAFAPGFGGGTSVSLNPHQDNWGFGYSIPVYGGHYDRGDLYVKVRYLKYLEIPFVNELIAQVLPRLYGRPVNPATAMAGNKDTNFWTVSGFCRMPYEGNSRSQQDEARQGVNIWSIIF
jgi:hypothetical protein